MLVARRVTGFRAGPHAVEDLGAPFEVEAEALEIVIPVRVLDDALDLRVDGLRGADDQVAAGLVHPLQAVRGPAPVPLGGNLHVLLAAGEEEVVQEQLVEVAGRRLGHLLHPFPVFRVRIAEGFEVVRLADGVRDAAGDLEALLLEELLGLLERGVVDQEHVAVRLQVDLVHVQLAGDGLPGGFEPLGVFHLFHFIRADIDGNGEILVLGLRGGRQDKESEQD